jgi:Flp pilus assembly protein TadD
MIQRIVIIPVALLSGLLLAAGSGFYIWCKNPATPMMQTKNVVAPQVPVVLSPASIPVTTRKLPLALPPDNPVNSMPSSHSVVPPGGGKRQRANNLSELKAPAALAPPIRIEHNRESDPVDPILLAAWQAYRNGDFDTASQHYSEVLRKDALNNHTPDRDALLGMAAIAQQRSQDAIAAQYYNQLLALDPRDPDAHAGLSSLLGATGAPSAESRLKLLLAQRPESAALHFALANHYADQSRWEDAEQSYFSACKLESDNAQFAFNLAVSLDHLGQAKLAAQHYRHALKLDQAGNPSFDHAQTQLRLDELTSHLVQQHE